MMLPQTHYPPSSLRTELSSQEMAMGEYLFTFGESELTTAGDVMQSVGRVQETNAKAR